MKKQFIEIENMKKELELINSKLDQVINGEISIDDYNLFCKSRKVSSPEDINIFGAISIKIPNGCELLLRKIFNNNSIIINEEDQYRVINMINALDENKALTIKYRYGISVNCKTYTNIAKEIGCMKELIKDYFIEPETSETISEAEQDFNKSIASMGLCLRSFNGLNRSGIKTIEEVSKLDLDELGKLRNIGVGSITEIASIMLFRYGIKLNEGCHFKYKFINTSSKTLEVFKA